MDDNYIIMDNGILKQFIDGKVICAIFGVRKETDDKRQICLPFTYEDFIRELGTKKFNNLLPFVSTYIKMAYVNDCLNYNEIPRIEKFIFMYKEKYKPIWREWFIIENTKVYS